MPLPIPSSLLAGLNALERSISDFEASRDAATYSASSADSKITVVADGMCQLESVSIDPSLVATMTTTALADAVRVVVNAALQAAATASSSAVAALASNLVIPGLPNYGSPPPNYTGFAPAAQEIIDYLKRENPCDAHKSYTCRAGRVEAVVNTQRQVVSLKFDEPLPDHVPYLGVLVVDAVNCAVHKATERPDDTDDIVDVIDGHSAAFSRLVLYANGDLRIGDRSEIKTVDCAAYALIGNAGTGETNIGNRSHVGNVLSRAKVVLRSNGRVHGWVTTTSTFELQTAPETKVDGKISQNTTVALAELALSVTFPAKPVGSIELAPKEKRSAGPGYYTKIVTNAEAELTLTGGVYYLDELQMEPKSKIRIDATRGPVVFWVRNTVKYSGEFVDVAGSFPRVFVGYLGGNFVALETSFRGQFSAPNARIKLATAGVRYAGAFHAKHVEVEPDVTVCHRPFELSYGNIPR